MPSEDPADSIESACSLEEPLSPLSRSCLSMSENSLDVLLSLTPESISSDPISSVRDESELSWDVLELLDV